MKWIDVRSDTVTMPTQAMRNAMLTAEVGDDVFMDDPTVTRLEELAAKMFGKEAALFVASGTQGNQVSVMSHTKRGDAIIMSKGCHIADHEAGAYIVLAAGVPVFPKEENGIMIPASVAEYINLDDSDPQSLVTGLVCLENALSNGGVMPLKTMQEIYKIANKKCIPVHLDGARIFNAAANLGVNVSELTACCDSVSVCLSKGLCAPVGSVVAGSKDFIRKARKWRKMLGGGMRQVGILAAAGIISLEEMSKRVGEDHENAKYLASKISALNGINVNLNNVQINMIFYTVDWAKEKIDGLEPFMRSKGIKVTPFMGGEFRMVTHNDISKEDCDTIFEALKEYTA